MPMEPVPLAAVTNRSGWRYAYSAAREEKLRYVQSLLAHARPGASVDRVLDLALDCLQDKLERQKFGKCSRPGKSRGSKNPRYIPLEVKRAVWERDGGRCAYVGTGGKRCDARAPLEFDHLDPVARGGRTTLSGVRLLCRAHNQYSAERTYGSEFMEGKRKQGRERTAKARAEANARAQASGQERADAAAEAASQQEVIPWLRALGCNLETARNAAARSAGMVGAPLERRVFVACQGLGPRATRRALPLACSSAS
jgi:5-methylcytosine-specific restriction endonuclease McrA